MQTLRDVTVALRFAVISCVILVGCGPAPPNAIGQKSRAIFSTDMGQRIESQALPASTLRARRARVESAAMVVDHSPGARFLFNLFADAQFDAVADKYETLSNDTFEWSGHLVNLEGTFTVLRRGQMISLTLRSPGKAHYAVLPGQDGNNLIYEFDPSKFGECALAQKNIIRSHVLHTKGGAKLRAVQQQTSSTDLATISVLVLYTPAVKQLWGGTSGTELVIDHIVLETNVAYVSSQIKQSIVVTKSEIAYTESGSLDKDLKWLRGSKDVADLRNSFKSDLVAMILNRSDDPTAAGVGNVMATVDHGFESQAFSVTVAAAARDNYSFAHELAHNMGACHTQDDHKCAGAFSYSFGWRFTAGSNNKQLRTIMAYPPGERIGYFSNPDVQYNFVSTGNPDILPNPADNAKTLNNSKDTVANFR